MDRIIIACATLITMTCLARQLDDTDPSADAPDRQVDRQFDEGVDDEEPDMYPEDEDPFVDVEDEARPALPHLPSAAEFANLIAALKSDDIPMNMLAAVNALSDTRLMPSLLEELPKAHDIQQRDGLLVAITRAAAGGGQIPPALFDDVFELLDATGYERSSMLGHYGNPWSGNIEAVLLALSKQMRYAPARSDLIERFHHADPRQQFFCAFVLARTGCLEEMDALLVYWRPHLEDNAIREDGRWARRAVVGLGEPALPTLRAWREETDDKQLVQFIDLIVASIQSHHADPWDQYDCRGVPEETPYPWRVVAAIHGQPTWKPPSPSALVAKNLWQPFGRDFDEDLTTSSPESSDAEDTQSSSDDDAGSKPDPTDQP
jgi:hypothetical protein